MISIPAIFWIANASGFLGGALAVLWLATGRRNKAMLYTAFGLSMLFFAIRFGTLLFF